MCDSAGGPFTLHTVVSFAAMSADSLLGARVGWNPVDGN